MTQSISFEGRTTYQPHLPLIQPNIPFNHREITDLGQFFLVFRNLPFLSIIAGSRVDLRSLNLRFSANGLRGEGSKCASRLDNIHSL